MTECHTTKFKEISPQYFFGIIFEIRNTYTLMSVTVAALKLIKGLLMKFCQSSMKQIVIYPWLCIRKIQGDVW